MGDRVGSSRVRRAGRVGAVVAALVLVASGCSSSQERSDPDAASTAGPSSTSVASTTVDPASIVDLDDIEVSPVPDGGGTPFGAMAPDVEGYEESEYTVSGTASLYSGPATGPATVERVAIPYVTRILVRQPVDPEQFSGRVLIEPFNTSSGTDTDAVWTQTSGLLRDEGDAWIGVTVRAPSAQALREFDPERYVELDLSLNGLAWDVLRQVGALSRTGDDRSPLGEIEVEHVYMAGYSQSGLDVATFASAIDPLTRLDDGAIVYDGYFPAARSGSLTPLQSDAAVLPTFESAPMGAVSVPVLNIETQTDVEGFEISLGDLGVFTNPSGASVRRGDSDEAGDLYRLYEVAGAPHTHIASCDGEVSTFPVSAFVRASLVRLYRWVEQGEVPPKAGRIELSTDDVISVAAVDESGNAVAGVRSPFLDTPLARYDAHSEPGPLCALNGSQELLPAATLDERYGDAEQYLKEFEAALDEAIDDGTLLQQDRASILADQQTLAERAFT